MEDVTWPGRDVEEKPFTQTDPLREIRAARDLCHNERAGIAFTVATGIQLQSVVLTPTLWDTSKHQSVRGSRGEQHGCSLCVYVHIPAEHCVCRLCGLEALTVMLPVVKVNLDPFVSCRK